VAKAGFDHAAEISSRIWNLAEYPTFITDAEFQAIFGFASISVAICPALAETGRAAFYSGGRTASGEHTGPNGLTAPSHLAVWHAGTGGPISATAGRSLCGLWIAGHMAVVAS
jgi:hypothetical protein